MKRNSIAELITGVACAVLLIIETPVFSQDLPDAAMNMLAEIKTETCVICQEKLAKKAFAILEKELRPGKDLSFRDANRLILKQGYGAHLLTRQKDQGAKRNNEDMENRPEVLFRFHTDRNHLAGISRDDYTGKAFAEKLKRLRAGTAFHGTLQLIEFKYGDGTCFNFFQKQNEIVVHCKILSLD
ncbi:MAG TPA: hypothetical protein PLI62_11795 [Spirochaetota bacterium]|nr:hypothetical protein [Spirochaetota bacterium]HQP48542.1 hypothetical protein [Spirochaetota bacterium]